MTLDGTVVNGVVVFKGSQKVPEGAKVRVAFEVEVEAFEYPHPLAPYDRQNEIALLRKSHEELQTGSSGMPLDQFEAEFVKEFDLAPRTPRE